MSTRVHCKGLCQIKYFREQNNISNSISTTCVRKTLNPSNKYLFGFRRCTHCDIFYKDFTNPFCPCCGFRLKTRRTKTFQRSVQIRERFRMDRTEELNHFPRSVKIKLDIIKDLDKWKKLLANRESR